MSDPTRLAVVGAGPGGYTAAFLAADLGMQVCLIDEAPRPGGVCLYRGCMPSKALLHVARVLAETRDADAWGISFGEPTVDLERLRSWKEEVVGKLTGGLAQLSEQRKVDYLQGRAAFVGPTSLSVQRRDGATETRSFDAVILATGSRPSRPGPLGVESPRVLDSTSALDLKDIPGRLLVVGGGYIGLELGTVYAALGSNVTVVEMTSSVLPGVDKDLVRVLMRRLGQVAHAIRLDTTVTALRPGSSGVEVDLSGGADGVATERFEAVLVAVGRSPNSDIGGLEQTAVEVDDRGFIKVDSQRRTAEPSIYAIGDVAGEPMLAHKAFHEARVAVEAIAGRETAFEPAAIPAVVFTDPEIAWCGVTESQASEQQRAVTVSRFPWAASGRALTLGRPDGMTKLVIDLETDQVIGVGIVGVGAGELIAEGVIAVEMGATASDLSLSIHPHPTLSETLLEAADVSLGHSTHVYRPLRKS